LSEGEVNLVEKLLKIKEELGNKFPTIEQDETAEHYLHRLEKIMKSKSK
jgi:hypothetical protein